VEIGLDRGEDFLLSTAFLEVLYWSGNQRLGLSFMYRKALRILSLSAETTTETLILRVKGTKGEAS